MMKKYDGLEWVVVLYDEILKMTCSMLAIHGQIVITDLFIFAH